MLTVNESCLEAGESFLSLIEILSRYAHAIPTIVIATMLV